MSGEIGRLRGCRGGIRARSVERRRCRERRWGSCSSERPNPLELAVVILAAAGGAPVCGRARGRASPSISTTAPSFKALEARLLRSGSRRSKDAAAAARAAAEAGRAVGSQFGRLRHSLGRRLSLLLWRALLLWRGKPGRVPAGFGSACAIRPDHRLLLRVARLSAAAGCRAPFHSRRPSAVVLASRSLVVPVHLLLGS